MRSLPILEAVVPHCQRGENTTVVVWFHVFPVTAPSHQLQHGMDRPRPAQRRGSARNPLVNPAQGFMLMPPSEYT